MGNKIMQGDAYSIPITLTDKNGDFITTSGVSDVEIAMSAGKQTIIKKYSSGQVTYSNNGVWLFPVTQSETFNFSGSITGRVRVKFSNGDVIGGALANVSTTESISKDVI